MLHTKSIGDLLHQTISIRGIEDWHITNLYKESVIRINTLWGSRTTSRGGLLWENFANERNLTILNDGSPTLLNTRNTSTAIDVSIATNELALWLNWQCFSHEISDHFPIFIQMGKNNNNHKSIYKDLMKNSPTGLFLKKILMNYLTLYQKPITLTKKQP